MPIPGALNLPRQPPREANYAASAFCAAVASVFAALAWKHYDPQQPHPSRRMGVGHLLAAAERQTTLLLTVVGEVYDVSAGRSLYGRGESYAFFANGEDASRAFLTGESANATDNLDGLLPGACLGIEHWRNFYATHATYRRVGTLAGGRFYTARLRPTAALRSFDACVERGEAARAAARAAVRAAPPCATSSPPRDEDPRFQHGVWRRHSCDPPRVPRWLRDAAGGGGGTADEAIGVAPPLGGAPSVDRCACLRATEAAEGGWEPSELGMEDDAEIPVPYPGCDLDASSCVRRSG